jgi:hypothetical protein
MVELLLVKYEKKIMSWVVALKGWSTFLFHQPPTILYIAGKARESSDLSITG